MKKTASIIPILIIITASLTTYITPAYEIQPKTPEETINIDPEIKLLNISFNHKESNAITLYIPKRYEGRDFQGNKKIGICKLEVPEYPKKLWNGIDYSSSEPAAYIKNTSNIIIKAIFYANRPYVKNAKTNPTKILIL